MLRRSFGSARRRTKPSFSSRSISWVMLERTHFSCWASSESGNGSPASTRQWSTPTFASDSPTGLSAASSRASTLPAVPSKANTSVSVAAARREGEEGEGLRRRLFISASYRSPAVTVKRRSLVFLVLGRSQLRRQGMSPGQDHERDLDDEEPERQGDHETRLPRGAVDRGNDDDAENRVEDVVQHRERHHPAQHGERVKRLARQHVDERDPEPDACGDDEPEPGALAQRVVCQARVHVSAPGQAAPTAL